VAEKWKLRLAKIALECHDSVGPEDGVNAYHRTSLYDLNQFLACSGVRRAHSWGFGTGRRSENRCHPCQTEIHGWGGLIVVLHAFLDDVSISSSRFRSVAAFDYLDIMAMWAVRAKFSSKCSQVSSTPFFEAVVHDAEGQRARLVKIL
jgi:hypothetical protein